MQTDPSGQDEDGLGTGVLKPRALHEVSPAAEKPVSGGLGGGGLGSGSSQAGALHPGALEDGPQDAAARDAGAAPRYSRRLSDKILISFHQACDQNDFDVAQQLLRVYEYMLTRREMPADLNRRRSLDSLVAAHERLWHLRHPERR